MSGRGQQFRRRTGRLRTEFARPSRKVREFEIEQRTAACGRWRKRSWTIVSTQWEQFFSTDTYVDVTVRGWGRISSIPTTESILPRLFNQTNSQMFLIVSKDMKQVQPCLIYSAGTSFKISMLFTQSDVPQSQNC